MEIMTIIISTINIYFFYPQKYDELIHIIFLFDSHAEWDVPFINAQVFIHPIIVCHHNF